jgi:hypothetical protein
LTEGSQKALDNETWRDHLPLAFKARGIDFDALSLCEKPNLVFKCRRELAPNESVQIPTLADLAGSLIGPS